MSEETRSSDYYSGHFTDLVLGRTKIILEKFGTLLKSIALVKKNIQYNVIRDK